LDKILRRLFKIGGEEVLLGRCRLPPIGRWKGTELLVRIPLLQSSQKRREIFLFLLR